MYNTLFTCVLVSVYISAHRDRFVYIPKSLQIVQNISIVCSALESTRWRGSSNHHERVADIS